MICIAPAFAAIKLRKFFLILLEKSRCITTLSKKAPISCGQKHVAPDGTTRNG
jgi:hypothetical protein